MTEQKKQYYIKSLEALEPVVNEILAEQNMHTGVKASAQGLKSYISALKRFVNISETEGTEISTKAAQRFLNAGRV